VFSRGELCRKRRDLHNSERRVQRVRQAIEPLGNARPDWQIIAELSGRLGVPMKYNSPAEIMQEIASLTPSYGGSGTSGWRGWGCSGPVPPPTIPGLPSCTRQVRPGKGKFHVTPYVPPPNSPTGNILSLDHRAGSLPLPHRAHPEVEEPLRDLPRRSGGDELGRSRRLGIRPDNGLSRWLPAGKRQGEGQSVRQLPRESSS